MTDRSLPSETADALCITHDGSVAALDTAAMVAGLESVGRRRSGGRWGASFADHETFRVLCIGCVQDGAVRSRLETRCLERNTNTNTATQIITQDNIGVSAVAGTGTLPLHDNGRHNLLDPVDPANNASWLYPRLGSLPGDSGGGREPAGAGGWRVLLQVGFCPVGQVCGAGTGGGGAAAA